MTKPERLWEPLVVDPLWFRRGHQPFDVGDRATRYDAFELAIYTYFADQLPRGADPALADAHFRVLDMHRDGHRGYNLAAEKRPDQRSWFELEDELENGIRAVWSDTSALTLLAHVFSDFDRWMRQSDALWVDDPLCREQQLRARVDPTSRCYWSTEAIDENHLPPPTAEPPVLPAGVEPLPVPACGLPGFLPIDLPDLRVLQGATRKSPTVDVEIDDLVHVAALDQTLQRMARNFQDLAAYHVRGGHVLYVHYAKSCGYHLCERVARPDLHCATLARGANVELKAMHSLELIPTIFEHLDRWRALALALRRRAPDASR
jgi:hypothetical protein